MTRGPHNSASRYLSEHPATRAGTVHTPDHALIKAPERAITQVAEYSRGPGAVPYRVMRDTTCHPPYGLHRVYTGSDQIGTQLSLPNAEDCQRMLRAYAGNAPAYASKADGRARTGVLSSGRRGKRRAA